jgi:acetyl-CoA C-acetyltransferase
MTENAYIFDAIRTPRGRAKDSGGLHGFLPFDLLNTLYLALEERTGLDSGQVGEVVLGCVTQHGEQAGNIAKTSTLYAGWPTSISGMTVTRFCSSGLDAVNIAALKVAQGQENIAIGGGVEMMSRVPMLADQAAVFTNVELAVAARILMMGSGADLIASLYGVSREEADGLALESQRRAAAARNLGHFRSIVPVRNAAGNMVATEDECIRPDLTMEDLARLEPSFAKLGAMGVDALQLAAFPDLSEIRHIHTAGNSPAMADAAALVLVGGEEARKALRQGPRARIVATVNASDDPLLVLSGAVAATGKLLQKVGLTSADIDLFEIHEAFAATIFKCRRDLDIPDEKLNVNGGCIALGHPLGATGAIMLGTLLDEMERRDVSRGIVAASGAAGSGTAMLIER